MALFQVSVLKNYLKLQDEQVVDKAYKNFTSYFQHPEIQENIRKSKEEQFQATFLNELFVKILGYTLNPNPSYNLSTEFKNESNNRKADGAILKDGNAIGVIELKGTNTKHLEGIRQQAFDYKANQKHCVYVITSNFEKLRFYIQDATEFLEFDLFELNREDFGLLWLCLHKEHILNGLPLKIKEASLGEEEEITKEFYKDYSLFKRELFRDLVQRNVERLKDGPPGYESDAHHPELDSGSQADNEAEKHIKLNLFKKSQKLIDRFLFIFFAEDRGLLPPNAIVNILSEWNQLKDLDAEIPLYERFKQYFRYLNHGRPATETRPEIYAYNGGLFKPDELLDGLEIDDNLLYKHTSKLAKYDFESQVDVNILGHIFENSLNEIESVSAEIEGADFDKQKSKRKKDGVFYTPKYITKYIVENTIGRLCEEKKSELGFREEEYFRGRKRRQKDTLEGLVKILDDYRDWLLQLTICDPACGSGAFLNQALDFLIKEHRYIDEMKAKLLGGSIILSDIENIILERNIYGVDINEESVEIAKLSLWLRTAQPNRKLNDLSGNIKCGNSLIDDEAVAGNKAFKWEEEFPEVFDPSSGSGGGFDVVIGNPPYVDIKGMETTIVKEFFKTFRTAENRINLYSLFIEKGFYLLKDKGFLSFINPNSILVNSSYSKIRELLLPHMTAIIKLPDGVFVDAIVETIIFEFQKNSKIDEVKTIVFPKDQKINFIDDSTARYIKKINWSTGSSDSFNIYVTQEQLEVLEKISSKSTFLGDIADFTLGITPYDKYKGHSQEVIKGRAFHSDTKENEFFKPLISGSNIMRFMVSDESQEFINYGDWLGAPREERFFKEPRVLVRQIVSGNPPRIYAGYTNKELYFTQIGFGIIPKTQTVTPKTLTGLLSSKLINFYHTYTFLDLEKELFQKILIANCKRFPITTDLLNCENSKLDDMVTKIIALKEEKVGYGEKFQSYFSKIFLFTTVPKKLQSWHELEFGEFIKELNKAIKAGNKVRVKEGHSPVPELTKKDEFEWMELFDENKQKAVELQREIEKTDAEIDRLVYDLYGLTEEEIQIVESSN